MATLTPTKHDRERRTGCDGTQSPSLSDERDRRTRATTDAERRRRPASGDASNRSTTIDSRAAASRILMIGSSNFSRNFFQSGSRGSGREAVGAELRAAVGDLGVGQAAFAGLGEQLG